ncbi:probable peptidoglycan muropeptide transporter SLC46 isoform X2 [Palaemon carinicauda]|uniref:probable peptidoglycan muropeptide transporter SLC46 isoform X2 n=1 Tax=Palaemon carinicauda TaxID=392227 RepID=UPI0035B5A551
MTSYVAEDSPLLPKHQLKDEPDPQTTCQKLVSVFLAITVEPAYFLFSIYYGIEGTMLVNLWVDKVCLNLYTEDVCRELDSGKYTQQQDIVQSTVNRYKSAYSQWIEYLPAVVMVVVLGAWSDAKDRRLPVVLPLVGFLLKSLGLVACSYWQSLSPSYILIASVPIGLTGGTMGLALGINSYLSAVSSVRSRTARLSLPMILLLTGIPTGKAISTLLYSHFGYVTVFAVDAALNFFAIFYSVCRLQRDPGRVGPKSQAASPKLLELLSLQSMKETLSVVWKKRDPGAKSHIIGHILIISGLYFDMGNTNFLYLYTRKRFGWDIYQFTVFTVLLGPFSALGTIIAMPILSYGFQLNDCLVGFAGAVSFMLTNIILATAPEGWFMYLAVGTFLVSGTSFAASRGALSKLVTPAELGSIFSIVALGETIIPLFNGPFYAYVYNATLELYPGAIFAIAACIFALICSTYAWLYTHPIKRTD